MDAERTLLGLILKTSDGLEVALKAGVTAEAFDNPVCRSIFKAVRSLDDEGKRYSLPNLAKALGPGMVDDLTAISSGASLTQNAQYYADEVVALAELRSMQAILQSLHAEIIARRPYQPLTRIKQKWESSMSFDSGLSCQDGPRLIGDIIPEWIEDLERRMKNKASSNLTTGFPVLDLIFHGGWHRGGFYVIAARPGRGKTTFALSSAIDSAFAVHKVIFGTVEMTALDIATKAVSNIGSVSTGAFVKADLTEEESDRTHEGVKRVHGIPLWIDDSWKGDWHRFASNCRRIKRKYGLDIIILDYIGLARLLDKNRDRKEELDELSSRCKLLAIELDVAFLALAQLNREAEKFDRPAKHQIADSDNLGRDADGVLLLYRSKPTADQAEQSRLCVDKNRWGREIDVPVNEELGFSRFKPADLNLAAFE